MEEIKKDQEVKTEVIVEEVKAEEVAQEPVQQYNTYNAGQQTNGNPLSIASLVLGIVAIIFDFIFAWAGLILGIVGIVLGVKGRKTENAQGMATAGFVCSIIAVVIFAVVILVALCFVGVALGAGLSV